MHIFFPLVLCLAVSSCTSIRKTAGDSQGMLARSKISTSDGKWISLKMVRDAFGEIVVGTTTTDDLKELGFSIGDKNVTWLNHHELRNRFTGNIHLSYASTIIEKELLECIEAGRSCHGRVVFIAQTRTIGREGFVSSTILRKEINETSGWSFEATIALQGDIVVYAYPDKITERSYEYLESRNPKRAVSDILPF